MPGNPTSCLSNATSCWSRSCALAPPHTRREIPHAASRRIASAVNRHQFYTVHLRRRGVPAFKGSGDITSLSQADGYIEIPADQASLKRGRQLR
jgi:molybdopterin biosynthesis enzyme